MKDHEVENILDKRTVGKKEEYLLKWKDVKKPSWEPKTNLLNCNELLLEFEKSRGPIVLGAKREGSTANFLVKFDEHEPKVMGWTEVKPFAVSIIQFLEAKIEWDEGAEAEGDGPELSVLVEPRNANGKFIYAAKTSEGIVYFLQYENGEISIMPSIYATVWHSQTLVDYLQKCIV
ncbi:uncharacterized protein LOC129571289 [Sitodiplosis mosellana]|uniref:uncharacterized protein LOC129571289 n=1 Tax=Sitodiplosis mosellana TaxID=263140 RepID=UPI002443FDA3|nr:uncharacterized protein LOC129571289 [Sitodiplosis mosellana]